VASVTSSPIRRCSISSQSRIVVFTSNVFGWITCFRLNANSCLVKLAARSAALRISSALDHKGLVWSRAVNKKSHLSAVE
jgi:hypothetical protein